MWGRKANSECFSRRAYGNRPESWNVGGYYRSVPMPFSRMSAGIVRRGLQGGFWRFGDLSVAEVRSGSLRHWGVRRRRRLVDSALRRRETGDRRGAAASICDAASASAQACATGGDWRCCGGSQARSCQSLTQVPRGGAASVGVNLACRNCVVLRKVRAVQVSLRGQRFRFGLQEGSAECGIYLSPVVAC